MWSLILYFLFGIGQPANTNSSTNSSIINVNADDIHDDGDGGDKGNPPPKG
ncbi:MULTISPECIES: hypothetical protein [Sphingobacterium]|uniref:Uncharacterized protein n=1 Tax=Sphingobacterium zeae TaxID=1776859 RepID=A0ABU0UAM8_9SPHI|nr:MULTISPECIES: hypothetical protein [Sphingobacterium]MDQ1151932.1 hypothetical protein [Sphingobacterium zeae]MDR6734978.1 hypothetical protein [Sphingobacterium sp. 2149]